MDSSARFPRPVFRARPAQRSERDLADFLIRELQALSRRDPGEARRRAIGFMKDHNRALRALPGGLQPSLFPETLPRPELRTVAADVVPISAPYLLDGGTDACPDCRRRLIERSRAGARVYYTCSTKGCHNRGGVFIGFLGTGDD